MRLPTTLAGLLYLVISQAPTVTASPVVPKEELENGLDWIKHLFDRQGSCAGTYCGISSQYCCTGGSTCYTDANTIARCGAPTAAAFAQGWQVFTTTITTTGLLTIVSTYSVAVGAIPTQNLPQSTAICNANQIGCGAVCCDPAAGYTCATLGMCATSGAAAPTTSPVAPFRGTSGTATTITAVVSATTAFQAPTSTINGTAVAIGSGSSGLSGGAIAGIVIGVLAGIIILIAVCFCCVLKAGIDGILGLFGLRNRSRERTEVIEERYSRHGSAASRRDTHGGWFGGGGGGRSSRTEKKKSGIGEGGIIVAILAGLAGLWALLGLRRRSKERKSARSEVSYGTYSDSYSGTGTSESESSPISILEQRYQNTNQLQ
jgi:hypothetical protein